MELLQHIFYGCLLVATNIAIHALVTFRIVMTLARLHARERRMKYTGHVVLLTSVVLCLLSAHLVEVGIWAVFYYVHNCFPDFDTSAYFSLGAYTTVGSEILLERHWRLFGGSEALVGMLMIGWSTALLITLVTWIYLRRYKGWDVEDQSTS